MIDVFFYISLRYSVAFDFVFFFYSHLTLTVCEEAECKSLSHISKVADASGVSSTGTSQGAEKIIGQITAALLQGSPLCLSNYLKIERHAGE